MSSSAASIWQNQAYKKISFRLKLASEEVEEIQYLKLKADKLREIRKRLLNTKWD